jgi:hypothetical protein
MSEELVFEVDNMFICNAIAYGERYAILKRFGIVETPEEADNYGHDAMTHRELKELVQIELQKRHGETESNE